MYVTELAEYIDLVGDIISYVHQVGDNKVAVDYTREDKFIEVLENANPVLAVYSTTQAQLKLYSYIEKLQKRVLYFNTDSVIYLTQPRDSYNIALDDYLGDMTKELNPETYIKEFVAGGSENYAYKVNTSQKTLKITGFPLDVATSEQLDMDTIKRLVHKLVEEKAIEIVPIFMPKISRTMDHKAVTMWTKKD